MFWALLPGRCLEVDSKAYDGSVNRLLDAQLVESRVTADIEVKRSITEGRSKVFREVPPKVEYTLTEIGNELIPFIQHLKEWGDKQIKARKSAVALLEKSKLKVK